MRRSPQPIDDPTDNDQLDQQRRLKQRQHYPHYSTSSQTFTAAPYSPRTNDHSQSVGVAPSVKNGHPARADQTRHATITDLGGGRMRVVILVPHDEHIRRWARECQAHCDAHGYDLVAVVEDRGDGDALRGAAAMIAAGDADIILAARIWHLTRRGQLPRIEIADAGGGAVAQLRRPHPRQNLPPAEHVKPAPANGE